MTEKTTYLTKQGLEKLEQELEQLTSVKRNEIAHRIEAAKELGDLSENAEYHQAKDDQAFNEGRIVEIRGMLANAVVINHKKADIIEVGSWVKVKLNGDTREFTIVGASEADPVEGLISNESPIGAACLGKKVGDKVEVDLPSKTTAYTILEVE